MHKAVKCKRKVSSEIGVEAFEFSQNSINKEDAFSKFGINTLLYR